MDSFLRAAVGVCVIVLAAGGVAAVVRDWTPPWGRTVVRPRLWGYGSLLGAVGMTLFAFLGPLHTPRPAFGILPVLGWVAFMAGLFVQSRGLRAGRRTPTTKTSA
ncbi:hypothetical protein ACYF6T_32895 [Streptomyces sp. 7R007]